MAPFQEEARIKPFHQAQAFPGVESPPDFPEETGAPLIGPDTIDNNIVAGLPETPSLPTDTAPVPGTGNPVLVDPLAVDPLAADSGPPPEDTAASAVVPPADAQITPPPVIDPAPPLGDDQNNQIACAIECVDKMDRCRHRWG